MFRPLSLLVCVPAVLGLAASLPALCQAKTPAHKHTAATSQSADKAALLHAIGLELGHATTGHIKVSPYKVTKLDIKKDWALANVDPGQHAMLDAFKMLMHKRKGNWGFVTLGTDFHGVGKQFYVPKNLWKGWGL